MMQATFTRRFILGGALVSVTALHLTGCTAEDTQLVQVETGGQFFTSNELTLLNDVAEIMIPRTDTPGAMDAEVAAVIDGLMLTWAVESTRNQFRVMLQKFKSVAQKTTGKPYENLRLQARHNLVASMDEAAFSEDAPDYATDYQRLKDLIFRVFYTSEEGSADHVPIPGIYSGNLSLGEYEALMEDYAHGR